MPGKAVAAPHLSGRVIFALHTIASAQQGRRGGAAVCEQTLPRCHGHRLGSAGEVRCARHGANSCLGSHCATEGQAPLQCAVPVRC